MKIFPLLSLALCLAASCASEQSCPNKVLIDSDMVEGMDDGQALMMLLTSPSVEVVGITTVTGNSWADEGAAYAVRQMEICGAGDVPLYIGSRYPSRPGRFDTLTAEVEADKGSDGHWLGAVATPPVEDWEKCYLDTYGGVKPSISPVDGDAVDFIIRTLKENPGEVTVLAIGPCTNIAAAIRKCPGIEKLAKGIVYMGGCFFEDASTTTYAEFNVLYDPEAAAVCFRAGFPSQTIVSLDVCNKVVMSSAEYLDLYGRISDPALAEIFRHCANYTFSLEHPERQTPIWDVIAAAICIDESVICDTVKTRVDVLDDPMAPEYGRTVVCGGDKGGEAVIVTAVERKRIFDMLSESIESID